MTHGQRPQILGDVNRDCPSNWVWGKPTTCRVDALLLIFGPSAAACELKLAELVPPNQVAVRHVAHSPYATRLSDSEHFGFVDGVSQPFIDDPVFRDRYRGRMPDAHLVKPGEFVLGYETETGKPSQVPRLKDDSAETAFGRHGTYLVMRQLQQNVAGFWNCIRRAASRPALIEQFMQSPAAGLHGDLDSHTVEEWLAAKMVGRWPDGTSLVDSPARPAPPSEPGWHKPSNEFLYRGPDSLGLRCPIGAHVRRANPRDSLLENGPLSLDGLRAHRILRRGRMYGPDVEDRFVDDQEERGLFFICLNAYIERQFEFIQQMWIGNGKFSPVDGERDPIIGHSSGRGTFTFPGWSGNSSVPDITNFVRVRGGAYFFLPGRSAISRLCQVLIRAN